METDFYAPMLVPPFHPAPDWAESLAENLLHPHFSISGWEAFGRRYRRNYLWIYMVLGLSWLAKTLLLPGSSASWSGFIQNASIGELPGQVVLALGLGFNAILFLAGMLTSGLHQATGEVLPRFGSDTPISTSMDRMEASTNGNRAWFRLSRRRQQVLAMIITDKAEKVSESILEQMRRGVTALNGTGMYTGKSHSVLMIALTVTEVPQLKSLVSEADSQAFVIVSPAQEILGRGFIPLKMEKG
jgi:hypothetical protein